MAAARRGSIMSSSDHSGAPLVPSLAGAHRRMSRLDGGGLNMAGAVRRMSMMLRRGSMTHSQLTSQSHQPPVKLQNTYIMEPKDGEKFNPSRVEKVISAVLKSYLDEETYQASKCGMLSTSIADVIKSRVKDLDYARYKYVVHVIVGQNSGQCNSAVSRCLFFEQTDSFSSAVYKRGDIYAVGSVYAVYFE